MAIPFRSGTRAQSTGTSSATTVLGIRTQDGMAPDDLLVLMVAIFRATGATESVTTPSGWTAQITNQGVDGCRLWVFTKDAPASGDQANVSVTWAGTGGTLMGQMFSYRYANRSTFTAGNTTTGNTAAQVDAPNFTSATADELALCFVASDDNNTGFASFTGETGGDWVQDVLTQDTAGADQTFQIQQVGLPTSSTAMTGGSFTQGAAEKWVAVTLGVRAGALGDARVTQVGLEVWTQGPTDARVTQVGLEVWADVNAAAGNVRPFFCEVT